MTEPVMRHRKRRQKISPPKDADYPQHLATKGRSKARGSEGAHKQRNKISSRRAGKNNRQRRSPPKDAECPQPRKQKYSSAQHIRHSLPKDMEYPQSRRTMKTSAHPQFDDNDEAMDDQQSGRFLRLTIEANSKASKSRKGRTSVPNIPEEHLLQRTWTTTMYCIRTDPHQPHTTMKTSTQAHLRDNNEAMEGGQSESGRSVRQSFSQVLRCCSDIREQDIDLINAELATIPELSLAESHLYEYPLSGTHWIWPTNKVGGLPAYVVVKNLDGSVPKKMDGELRKNYVYGNGYCGYGYYHLMTQDAWKSLNRRYSVRAGLVKKVLRQRARGKARNDVHPNRIKFAYEPEPLNYGTSKEAKRFRESMHLPLMAVALGG